MRRNKLGTSAPEGAELNVLQDSDTAAPIVEDNVVEDDDMDTAAEKDNLEEVASEQEEDVECEGEEGATSDHNNSEDDQDEDFDEEEDGDELQEEEEHDGAHGMADNDDAEKEMPPPGEHRFLPDSSTRRAMRSTITILFFIKYYCIHDLYSVTIGI